MDSGGVLVIYILWCFAWGTTCAVIASDKNRSGFGWFVLGAVFGFFPALQFAP